MSARPTRERNMHVTTAEKRATFRKMHQSGCFVLPNPFDVGTAKALQHLGFKAIASTSAGFAWTIGKADNRVSLEEVCAHLAAISAAVDIPVNADFEGGFADEPEGVAANVSLAVETRSEEHTSELQSRPHLVCRLLLEKKKNKRMNILNNNKKQKHQHS